MNLKIKIWRSTKAQLELTSNIWTAYLTKNWKHVSWTTCCHKLINDTVSNLWTASGQPSKLRHRLRQLKWQWIYYRLSEQEQNPQSHKRTKTFIQHKKIIINKNKTWSSEGVHRNLCISARISDSFFESDSMESETESRNLTSSATELSDWLISPHSNAYKFGRKFPISASCVQLLLKFD